MANKQPIIVVGAGIAGLTAAFRLQQNGFAVKLLEALNDVGGRMATLSRGGFRMDLAVSIFPSSYQRLHKS
jgi:oxygen-dependent protoporphyrinogen oxidase